MTHHGMQLVDDERYLIFECPSTEYELTDTACSQLGDDVHHFMGQRDIRGGLLVHYRLPSRDAAFGQCGQKCRCCCGHDTAA